MRKRVVALVMAITAASCTSEPPTATPSTASPSPTAAVQGGTLRVVMPLGNPRSKLAAAAPEPGSNEPDPRLSVLDPHVDDWYDTAELLRCCLARRLLSTNGRSTEEGGAELRPDIASAMPEISADGLVWTFRLRQGVRYGPPLVDVEVTAADFVRSMHRLLSPELGTVGQFVFGDIVGAAAYSAGDAASITGLETPDEHTLVIRLTSPAGDLGARMALGMTAPLPPHPADPGLRFGTAEGHTLPRPQDGGPTAVGSYGRFLVSSGPYMLAGSEQLDFSMPAGEQAPVAGIVPGQSVSLVRNPNWDPPTDALRPARPERIELLVVPTIDAAVAELDAGRADLVMNETTAPTIPPEYVTAFQADAGRGTVHINEVDAIRGVVMNVAQPPFDDVHVRRAVSLVLDKRRLIELHGGPVAFRVADHMAPDAVLNNLLVDYAPYHTPDGAGDLAAAKAEMAQSVYDTDGDGVCDEAACQTVRALSREPYGGVAQVVSDSLATIGIELAVETLPFNDFFAAFEDPTQHFGVFVPLGWAKSVLTPAEFFFPYHSLTGSPGSLVGSTPEQLEEWGYDVSDVPSIDGRLDACIPLTGAQQFECWAALDQHIMENVVPMVPYGSELLVVLASPRVLGYTHDQLIGAPALDHIVLAP